MKCWGSYEVWGCYLVYIQTSRKGGDREEPAGTTSPVLARTPVPTNDDPTLTPGPTHV